MIRNNYSGIQNIISTINKELSGVFTNPKLKIKIKVK